MGARRHSAARSSTPSRVERTVLKHSVGAVDSAPAHMATTWAGLTRARRASRAQSAGAALRAWWHSSTTPSSSKCRLWGARMSVTHAPLHKHAATRHVPVRGGGGYTIGHANRLSSRRAQRDGTGVRQFAPPVRRGFEALGRARGAITAAQALSLGRRHSRGQRERTRSGVAVCRRAAAEAHDELRAAKVGASQCLSTSTGRLGRCSLRPTQQRTHTLTTAPWWRCMGRRYRHTLHKDARASAPSRAGEAWKHAATAPDVAPWQSSILNGRGRDDTARMAAQHSAGPVPAPAPSHSWARSFARSDLAAASHGEEAAAEAATAAHNITNATIDTLYGSPSPQRPDACATGGAATRHCVVAPGVPGCAISFPGAVPAILAPVPRPPLPKVVLSYRKPRIGRQGMEPHLYRWRS